MVEKPSEKCTMSDTENSEPVARTEETSASPEEPSRAEPEPVTSDPEKVKRGEKKPRSHAQKEATERMRLRKLEKKEPEKDVNPFLKSLQQFSNDFNMNLMYDLEKQRAQRKKENKWSELIDQRFSRFEEKFLSILDEPIVHYVEKNKKKEPTSSPPPIIPPTTEKRKNEEESENARKRGRFDKFF